jgi:large subunit ribosomal protein L24
MQRIRQNDLVEVVAGAEKGKRGRVVRVVPGTDQVIVQGLNLRYKHVRRSQKHQQGGRVRREMPMHISNVMLIDPSSDRPTRVAVQSEGDRKIRVAAKSGEALDKTKKKGG